MKAGNLMIVQGGPTAVFNASLSSAIAEATRATEFRKVFGARSGALGLSQGDFVDLSFLTSGELMTLRNSPGAALGSSRFKPTDEDLQRQVEQMRKLDVRYVLFMGGNGTMRGAGIVSQFCRSVGFEVQIMGVPKTYHMTAFAGYGDSTAAQALRKYVAGGAERSGTASVRSIDPRRYAASCFDPLWKSRREFSTARSSSGN